MVLVIGLVTYALGPLALNAFALGAFLLLLAYTGDHWHQRRLTRRFRSTFGPGKDLLVVYTASPEWLQHIETEWMPRWGSRAVFFNRSEPWNPAQLEARLWRRFGGHREHTPLAIVFPARGRPTVVRFFLAFRDRKHGKELALKAAEAELAGALAAAAGSGAA